MARTKLKSFFVAFQWRNPRGPATQWVPGNTIAQMSDWPRKVGDLRVLEGGILEELIKGTFDLPASLEQLLDGFAPVGNDFVTYAVIVTSIQEIPDAMDNEPPSAGVVD